MTARSTARCYFSEAHVAYQEFPTLQAVSAPTGPTSTTTPRSPAIEVPNVVGEQMGDARATLTDAGLTVSVEKKYSDERRA